VFVRYWTADDVQLMTGISRRLGRPGRWLSRMLDHMPSAAVKAGP
jgi:hypothetical protein